MKKLIKKIGYKSVTELKEAVHNEEEKALEFLQLVKEFFLIDLNEQKFFIRDIRALTGYLKSNIGFEKTEMFQVILLNSNNAVVGNKILSKGTVNKATIFPREISKFALEHGATGIIIAHNHPAGTLRPSNKDIEITNRLYKLFKMLDIKLLDSIIVNDSDYFSFLEEGLL